MYCFVFLRLENFKFLAFSVVAEGAMIEKQRFQNKNKKKRLEKNKIYFLIIKQPFLILKLSFNRFQRKCF